MGKTSSGTSRSRRARSANWTRAEAQRVLDAWRSSGLSQQAFASREGIGASRLSYWAEQLRGTETLEKGEPRAAALVPAIVKEAPRAAALVPAIVKMAPMVSLGRGTGPVVVHSPAGTAIEITEPTEVTPAWLAELVRELERRT